MLQDQNAKALDDAKRFVSHAPLPLTLLDLEGRPLASSERPVLSQTWSQKGVLQLAETTLSAGDAHEAATRLQHVLQKLKSGEPVVEDEYSYRKPGLGHTYIRAQTSYWRDCEDQPIAVLCATQDITAEVEARLGLKESEAQLRAVIENIPAQISLTDLETGRILLMNTTMGQKLAVQYGCEEGALSTEMLTPGEIERTQARIEMAEANGGTAEVEHTLEHGALAGSIFRFKYVLFADGRGRRQMLFTAEDITELRQAAEACRRSAAAAEAANLAKSKFLANMSHEIRTPLNGVLGVAGALAKTSLSAGQREMVSLVETSARTLETLLSDILDVARIESGKMELNAEPFDLETSIRACVSLFEAAAEAKGIEVESVILADARGGYVGDAARIRQILANLLGNAVKFTSTGKVTLTVEADHGPECSELRFKVRDTGIGFDAEAAARLFARFEQADGSITRRFGGSGLGLSISRSLADAMDGTLQAHAEPGVGAEFTFTINLARCEALESSVEETGPQGELDRLSGLRVLLAEDHPVNRRVVELILQAVGVDLTCVEDGAQAVEAFGSGNFDLILMDMQMPVMDGLTAVREIRKLESGARINIQMLTANAMSEHVSAASAAGADGHISKPIVAKDLLDRIANLAAHRGSQAGVAQSCLRVG